MHHGEKQLVIFHLKSHHIITMSRCRTDGNTSCLSLLRTDAVTKLPWEPSDRWRLLSPQINSPFFKFTSKTPHKTTLLFYSPVIDHLLQTVVGALLQTRILNSSLSVGQCDVLRCTQKALNTMNATRLHTKSMERHNKTRFHFGQRESRDTCSKNPSSASSREAENI